MCSLGQSNKKISFSSMPKAMFTNGTISRHICGNSICCVCLGEIHGAGVNFPFFSTLSTLDIL